MKYSVKLSASCLTLNCSFRMDNPFDREFRDDLINVPLLSLIITL